MPERLEDVKVVAVVLNVAQRCLVLARCVYKLSESKQAKHNQTNPAAWYASLSYLNRTNPPSVPKVSTL